MDAYTCPEQQTVHQKLGAERTATFFQASKEKLSIEKAENRMVGFKIMKNKLCCIVVIDRDLCPIHEINIFDMVFRPVMLFRTTFVSAYASTDVLV